MSIRAFLWLSRLYHHNLYSFYHSSPKLEQGGMRLLNAAPPPCSESTHHHVHSAQWPPTSSEGEPLSHTNQRSPGLHCTVQARTAAIHNHFRLACSIIITIWHKSAPHQTILHQKCTVPTPHRRHSITVSARIVRKPCRTAPDSTETVPNYIETVTSRTVPHRTAPIFLRIFWNFPVSVRSGPYTTTHYQPYESDPSATALV